MKIMICAIIVAIACASRLCETIMDGKIWKMLFCEAEFFAFIIILAEFLKI